jgi:hypothetical protein
LLFLIPLFIVYVFFFCTTEDTEFHRVLIYFHSDGNLSSVGL